MKIIAFSDAHIHEHEDFSYIRKDGMNSRLYDCLNVFDNVLRLYKKYSCGAVINGGDMFHTPEGVSTTTYQPAFMEAVKLANNVDSFLCNTGNHDLAVFSNIKERVATSVFPLSILPNTHLAIHSPVSVLVGDINVCLIPYVDDVDRFASIIDKLKIDKNAKRNIAVLHCDINEAVNGPNEVRLKTKMSYTSVLKKGFDFVLCGHHHHPQRLSKKAVVIGSPLQHNMLDRGDRRGVCIYDSKTNVAKYVWLKGPQFWLQEVVTRHSLDKFKAMQKAFKDSYVRVLVRTKDVSLDEVRERIPNARRLDVRYAIIRESVSRNPQLTKKISGKGLKIGDAVEDFVDHVLKEREVGVEKDELVRVGNELLAEVNK